MTPEQDGPRLPSRQQGDPQWLYGPFKSRICPLFGCWKDTLSSLPWAGATSNLRLGHGPLWLAA